MVLVRMASSRLKSCERGGGRWSRYKTALHNMRFFAWHTQHKTLVHPPRWGGLTHPALVNELLSIETNLFGEVLEQPGASKVALHFNDTEGEQAACLSMSVDLPSEQEGQQRTSEVQPFVTIVISVVKLPPPESRLQQSVHHVPAVRWLVHERKVLHIHTHTHTTHYTPKEVGLLGFTEGADANVRQNLLLQDLSGILDPPFPRHTRLGPTGPDEVQGNALLLNHEGLIQ